MTDPFIVRAFAVPAFIGATLFIALFLLDPWWKREFGRSVMAMTVGVWIFSGIVLIRIWTGPDFDARQSLRAISYALITYSTWSRFGVLLHQRITERRTQRSQRT